MPFNFILFLEHLRNFSRTYHLHTLKLGDYGLTIRWLRHACQRGRLAQNPAEAAPAKLHELGLELDELVNEYQAIWSLHNRPGGLKDSLSHFEAPRKDYLEP